MVWYSRLLKNFPHFIVIHTVKGFGIINKAEIDVFWNSLAFQMIQWIISICVTASILFFELSEYVADIGVPH